jgi:hypothetical protein
LVIGTLLSPERTSTSVLNAVSVFSVPVTNNARIPATVVVFGLGDGVCGLVVV